MQAVQPQTFPVTFEYVGQTPARRKSRCARASPASSRSGYSRKARGQGGAAAVRHRSRAVPGAGRRPPKADVARAQAQKAQADRELARLQAARREARRSGRRKPTTRHRTPSSPPRRCKRRRRRLPSCSSTSVTRKVVAPISGLTSRAQKSEGSLVTANETLLTTISQIDPIWVLFSISENEQLRLNRAVAASQLELPKDNAYDVTVKLADGSTLAAQGPDQFRRHAHQSVDGTYEMRAEIANADGALKPGQFVRVILHGAERQNAIAVPQVAVLDGPQGKFVYVVGKDKDGKDIATPRPVDVGDWVDAEAPATSGSIEVGPEGRATR